MIENDLNKKYPQLGFGYMRLPKADGNFDITMVNSMVDSFLSHGFTLFDTAFIYEGAEEALRESLVKRYERHRFQIATKLSVTNLKSKEAQNEQFEISMTRLGVNFIDYYMLHGLSGNIIKKADDMKSWDFIKRKKEEGLVKHIGLSFHGTAKELDDIFSNHPEMEFVYLQINYLDWEDSKIQSKWVYEIARKYNKPIVVMEPTKGGLLAGADSEAAKLLKRANPSVSVASWAFRFVGSLEGIVAVLSGMGNILQIEDNAKTFIDFNPLSQKEHDTIKEAIALIKSTPRIQCTYCRYCVPSCPKKIWIPQFLEMYNDLLVHKTLDTVKFLYTVAMMESSGTKVSDCIKCGLCEKACPQHIKISDILHEISVLLD